MKGSLLHLVTVVTPLFFLMTSWCQLISTYFKYVSYVWWCQFTTLSVSQMCRASFLMPRESRGVSCKPCERTQSCNANKNQQFPLKRLIRFKMDMFDICTWLLQGFIRTEMEWIVLDLNWQYVISECIMIPWCMGNIKWQHSWLSPITTWLDSESLGPLLPSHGGSAQLCWLAAGHVLWTEEGGLLVWFGWLSLETLSISFGLGIVVMLSEGVKTPEMCSWRNNKNISLP